MESMISGTHSQWSTMDCPMKKWEIVALGQTLVWSQMVVSYCKLKFTRTSRVHLSRCQTRVWWVVLLIQTHANTTSMFGSAFFFLGLELILTFQKSKSILTFRIGFGISEKFLLFIRIIFRRTTKHKSFYVKINFN